MFGNYARFVIKSIRVILIMKGKTTTFNKHQNLKIDSESFYRCLNS